MLSRAAGGDRHDSHFAGCSNRNEFELRFFLIIETVGLVVERQPVRPQYGKSLSEKIGGKKVEPLPGVTLRKGSKLPLAEGHGGRCIARP